METKPVFFTPPFLLAHYRYGDYSGAHSTSAAQKENRVGLVEDSGVTDRAGWLRKQQAETAGICFDTEAA